MGIVFKARDPLTDRNVAIKYILPQFRGNPVIVERFLREARAMGRIDHPNVARVYSVGEDSIDGPYMVMEFLDGTPLDEVIRKGPLGEGRSIQIVIQVLAGLHAGHQKGIIHRDVKPKNIMLLKDDVVKVIDFGIAKMDSESTLTSAGGLPGSLAYISPEVLLCQSISPATDVYSIGISLFEMLMGFRPFRPPLDEGFFHCHINLDPPPLPNHISPEIREIVAIALRKDPLARFKTAEEMRGRLVEFATPKSKPVPMSSPPPLYGFEAWNKLALPRKKIPKSWNTRFDTLLLLIIGVCSVLLAGIIVVIFNGSALQSSSVRSKNDLAANDAVSTTRKTIREVIPYKTQRIGTSALAKGRYWIEHAGENGVREVTFVITSKNGNETSREVLDSRVIQNPTTERIYVGNNVGIQCSKGHIDDWFSKYCYLCGERLPPGNDPAFPEIYDPRRLSELKSYAENALGVRGKSH